MKFFNIDCHISVIEDVKNTFTNLGHSVDSVLFSGHAWVMGKESFTTEVITPTNWRLLDDSMCNSFYERYKHDLSGYDGFIVTYPPVFAKLFEKFNKPIIMYVPIRYEVPFSSKPHEWNKFNDFLKRTIDSGQLIPVANSLYDKKYCEYFIDREFAYIPNICDYTKTQYSPEQDTFLYESKLNIQTPNNVINKASLGRYKWEDIAKYKSIINIPYTSSTMSLFEHYTANIPMFMPSEKFLLELYSNKQLSGVMSEVTWNQIENLPQGSSILNVHKQLRNDDPNLFNITSSMQPWFALSDFYSEDMKFINHFDSMEDLGCKISTTNLSLVSSQMAIHNKARKDKVYKDWNNILCRIEKSK